jgi:hypothetical protein
MLYIGPDFGMVDTGLNKDKVNIHTTREQVVFFVELLLYKQSMLEIVLQNIPAPQAAL